MKSFLDNFGIFSYRRSGTHFLWESLNANFDIRKPYWYPGVNGVEAFKAHCSPMQVPRFFNISFEDFLNKYNNYVYIVRDLRDTLVAGWYYWQKGAENNLDISRGLVNISFSQYIRGASIDKACSLNIDTNSLYADNYLDPVQYWIDCAEWSKYVYTIRFEDLKLYPIDVMNQFSEHFDVKCKNAEYVIITKLVGNLPRKGIIGDWHTVFSDDDLEYVYARARNIMESYGYN